MWNEQVPRTVPAALRAAGVLALALAAGCDSGGRARASGGTSPALSADFSMRSDVRVADDVLADARSADLNGDGLADLVEAESQQREFVVAYGLPDGTFAAGPALAVGGVPWRSEFGDFDGNGLLDVATLAIAGGGGATPSVAVFLQEPLGTFSAAISLAMVADPDDLAVAPRSGLAGDPVPDELFVASTEETRVARVRLAATGDALEEVESLDTSNLGPAGEAFSVAVFDLRGDSTLDLAVAEARVGGSVLGRVVIYEREGAGFAAPYVMYEPVYWPTIDLVGDVDRDGLDDLAVSQVDGTDALLFTGDAEGTFGDPLPVTFGPGTAGVVFADFDGDGLNDAAAAVFEEAAVYVRMATGNLSWGPPKAYDMGFIPRSLGRIDLPGDPFPDLFVANVLDTSLLRSGGDGSFRGALGNVLPTRGPSLVAPGDLDDDGDPDLVVVSTRDPAVLFLETDGALGVTAVVERTLEAGADVRDLLLADGDGDGLLDAIVPVANTDEVRVYHNPNSPGSFASEYDSIAVGSEPSALDAADLDGDGTQDLVVALDGADAVEIWTRDPTSGFQPAGSAALSGTPLALRLADLDGDGDEDLIVTTAVPDAQLLVLDNSGGTFTQTRSFPLDSDSHSIAVGRVDSDSRPDIVVGQEEGDEFFLFIGRAGKQYEPRRVKGRSSPSSVFLVDLDEDGLLDVLVPSASGDVFMAMGNGLGAFPETEPAVPGALAILDGARSTALADMDGDDLPDLVYVAPQAPVVWIARNVSQEL